MLSGNPIQALHSAMFGSLDIFPLLAVPLFIYAGDIMSRGGIARRLIELILSLVGAVRGALGIATIAACEVFSVMSGSSVACVAAIGKLTIPALKKNGYGDTLLGQPGDRDRCDRHHHAAFDHDDHLRHRGAAVGAPPVSRRLSRRHPDRHRACDLCRGVCPGRADSDHGAGAPQGHCGPPQGFDLVAARAGGHSRRHLWRPVHADRSRRGRLHLRHRDLDVHLSRAHMAAALDHHRRLLGADRADPDHRLRRRRLRLADHDQRSPGEARRVRASSSG